MESSRFLGEAGRHRLAQLCKVLSVESRIHILELLRDRPLCVNALAGRLGVTPAAVSQHLRLLRQVGLVEPEKRGYFVHYHLNRDGLEAWRRAVHQVLRADGKGRPGDNAPQEGEKPCVARTPTAGSPRS